MSSLPGLLVLPALHTTPSLLGDNPWSRGCSRVREEDSFIFSWNCCHPKAPGGGRSRSLQASLAENHCSRDNRPRLRIRAQGQGHAMSSSSLTGCQELPFPCHVDLCEPRPHFRVTWRHEDQLSGQEVTPHQRLLVFILLRCGIPFAAPCSLCVWKDNP